jgi:hypothetical protein
MLDASDLGIPPTARPVNDRRIRRGIRIHNVRVIGETKNVTIGSEIRKRSLLGVAGEQTTDASP